MVSNGTFSEYWEMCVIELDIDDINVALECLNLNFFFVFLFVFWHK